MQFSRSDKFQSFALLSCFLPLAMTILIARPAQAGEQIAQAIPSAPPVTGIYASMPSKGALGQAIDQASSESAESEKSSSIAAGSAEAVSLPRIDSAPDEESKMIAQAAGNVAGGTNNDNALDLAPVKLPERTSAIFQTDQFKTGILYKLPARMFFQSSTENSLRLETNVFQTLHRNRADMIYRVLPNVTVGYALTKATRVSANYFYFRDQYTRNSHTLSRNIHSIGIQVQHDVHISEKTNLTAGFMGRQLLLSRSQPLSDLLPSLQMTRRVGQNGIVYGGVLGQIRFRNTLGRFQEGDQFYSFGGMYRTPRWQFLWDNTFITNFGYRKLRFGPNNQNMIMTLQADYRISKKLPIVAFVRAEPIFNIGANQATGFAGFNFRIYGGLRLDMNKQAIFPVDIKKRK
ncbi:MAG: hypothetical protein K2X27_01470 [Candidatus Obscuribacterales bacterium]|nr:hypothetical protein [Candidatus Obscuribacterales bacterium]